MVAGRCVPVSQGIKVVCRKRFQIMPSLFMASISSLTAFPL